MQKLTEVMEQQQRYALRQRVYTTDLSNLGYGAATTTSSNGMYTIAAAACGTGIERCVELTATPLADTPQVNDGATAGGAPIVLNSQGLKTWDGNPGWNHK